MIPMPRCAKTVIVGLVARDHAAFARVHHRACDRGLRRPEHLHRLLRPLMVTLLKKSVSDGCSAPRQWAILTETYESFRRQQALLCLRYPSRAIQGQGLS
jgi:hypothetical protein